MPRHPDSLPFTDDLKPCSLSTSMNGFRLDDLTTKSIVAYNQVHSHHSQIEKGGAQFSPLARVLLEPFRHPVANVPAPLRR